MEVTNTTKEYSVNSELKSSKSLGVKGILIWTLGFITSLAAGVLYGFYSLSSENSAVFIIFYLGIMVSSILIILGIFIVSLGVKKFSEVYKDIGIYNIFMLGSATLSLMLTISFLQVVTLGSVGNQMILATESIIVAFLYVVAAIFIYLAYNMMTKFTHINVFARAGILMNAGVWINIIAVFTNIINSSVGSFIFFAAFIYSIFGWKKLKDITTVNASQVQTSQ